MTAVEHTPTWSVDRIAGAPAAATLEEIRRLAAAASEADGNPPLSEQTLVTLRAEDAGERLLVITARSAGQPDSDLAGVAVITRGSGDGSVLELVVGPDCRGEGAGTALIEAVLAEGITDLRGWSHGNHSAAADLAARFGYAPVRELWRMRLTRAAVEQSVPALRLPDGVVLRPFVRGRDEEAWLAVNAAAFAHHPEQGATTRADLEARLDEDWFDAEGFLLAVRSADDTLLGFHWTKVHPGTGGHPAMGEVYVVGVAPEAQGTGLGKALTIAGIDHLHGKGLQAIMLYVDADNTAAVALYRTLGFTRWDVDVMYAPTAAQATL
ncbi:MULTISPECIES: mycothiol synthase [unclassified Arthrobacter]|uniref:mycothiol synthase n=1 Tax=unclassified Arthrobacter TaxID=235627 RepID=UPI00070029DD|nr:mycothiol synthase [Arthrobacter sp. Leaf234]KQO03755.1 mycothiol synthase [Arthrobacter sp. Leaf234]